MNTASVIAPSFIHSSIKRRRNTWYSINNGNWSDPLTWQSNASKRYAYPGQAIPLPIFPQVGDDVYIGHSVTIDLANNATFYINNLYVSGTLIANGSIAINTHINIYGDLQVTGSLICTGSNIDFILNGVNNFIVNYTAGSSKITYNRFGDQPVMPLTYFNITTQQAVGVKYFTGDVTVNGQIFLSQFNAANTDIQQYSLTVNGTTNISGGLIKTVSGGSVIFVGLVTNNYMIDFRTSNTNVEIRGGIQQQGYFYTGSGTWTFSTNNQTFTEGGAGSKIWDWTVIISGAITLTVAGTGLPISHMVNISSVNGNNAASTLTNAGGIIFTNTNVPMATGIFNNGAGTAGTTLGYATNSAFTLPYTSFQNLYLSSSASIATYKTLLGNTTVAGSLSIIESNFEASTFNLAVTGTTNFTSSVSQTISKTGSGSLLFIGLVSFNNATSVASFTGNPSIEFRGGLTLANNTSGSTGTGTITFSTNNQSIQNLSGTATISNPVLISGAITLTALSSGGYVIFTGTVNGNNAASTLDNRITSLFALFYQNTIQPMATGVLQTNAAANIWKYNMAGAQDVKGGTYRTIEFGGSGNKTLQGNVVINVTGGGSQLTTGTAVVVLNGFTITTI